MVNAEYDFGWGIVVNFQKKANQSKVSDFSFQTKMHLPVRLLKEINVRYAVGRTDAPHSSYTFLFVY